MKWFGCDRRIARARIEQTHNNEITLNRGDRCEKLPIVQVYKHVGTQCPANVGMGHEVATRAGAAWNKLQPLRKKLFQ